MAKRGRPRREEGSNPSGAHGGRARRRERDEEALPYQGTALDLRKVLTAAKAELAKLNGRISNLQDDTWVKSQIQKTTGRRDQQEVVVLTIEEACLKLGLTIVDELEFPGTPPDAKEPRPESREAASPIVTPVTPIAGALPPPSNTDCPHEWTAVDDDWRQCTLCGLMDGIPCRVATEAEPADEGNVTAPCPTCGGLLEAWEGTVQEGHTGIYHLSCAPWLQEEQPPTDVGVLADVTPESLAQPEAPRRRSRKPAAAEPAVA